MLRAGLSVTGSDAERKWLWVHVVLVRTLPSLKRPMANSVSHLAILALPHLGPHTHLDHLGRTHVPKTKRRRAKDPAAAACAGGVVACKAAACEGKVGEWAEAGRYAG